MDKSHRYLYAPVKEDLHQKMVFLSGPRQVGKTTFALNFIKGATATHPAYLNWDNIQDRERIQGGMLAPEQKLHIFDEIHKYGRWRGLIKGLYDKYHDITSFIVTGSARLDYFSKGGDSLLGRYHHYRLHPFTLSELTRHPTAKDIELLLHYSGFPEPLFAAREKTLRRWQKERRHKIIYEDLRDLESVKEASLIDLLVGALPSRIGSPLSIKSLSEDLQVSHKSVDRWLAILERLYISFRVSPFGSPKIRAVKKEQKLYLWDWSSCEDDGARFENMIASHLLKYCHFHEDSEGHSMELRYIRDTDGREVDFVVIKDKKPLFAVECKMGEKKISPHISYFLQRTPIPRFYQVHLGNTDYGNAATTGRLMPFSNFVKEVGLI